MNYPKYALITASSEFDVFEFVSKGKKGDIFKKIQFSETDIAGFYNLGFGDKKEDGSFDDASDSDNGDRDLILATVAGAVYDFTSVYPNRHVVFFGIDEVRTRLYRMAISNNIEVLNKNFHIFALVMNGEDLVTVPFIKNVKCDGFLVKRRTI